MTCTLSRYMCKVPKNWKYWNCLVFASRMDVLKIWFVVSAIGLLILMALDMVDWMRGFVILRKMVEGFMTGQGM